MVVLCQHKSPGRCSRKYLAVVEKNVSPEYLEAMHDYLANQTNTRSQIIIAGDLNLPGITWWNISHDGKDSQIAEALLTTAFDFSLQPLVSGATRIDSSSSLTWHSLAAHFRAAPLV